jgi:hypothetical protein
MGRDFRMYETEVKIGFLMGRPKERGPLGTLRRRWEGNIKMDVRVIGWLILTGLIRLRIETSGKLL